VSKHGARAADVYQRPQNDGSLSEGYIMGYDQLRIFKAQESTQLLKQADKIKELENEIQSLRIGQGSEVDSLRAEVSELKEMLRLLFTNPKLAEELKR
jgi:hypothetical protein